MTSIMSLRDLGKMYEAKFAIDQALQFKIETQMYEMVGEWAAERIGLDPENSQRFVKELGEWHLRPGNKDLKSRLMADFAANRIEVSENAIERLIALKSTQARKKFIKD